MERRAGVRQAKWQLGEFHDFLKSQSLKLTPERVRLLEEILATGIDASSPKHFDADMILVRMRNKGGKVSRATIYRTLDLLVKSGQLRKERLGNDQFLYEHVSKGQHHDHLICTHCGKIMEFENPQIERLQERVCESFHFTAIYHMHQIFGLCAKCRVPARS